jgi:hypothetical protein
VWIYGGDGAFGFEQRDEHTIASELVRVAARHGITLDVTNRGVPEQLHWRAALRFAWDLTGNRAPDLVLFYEGAEEVAAALQLTKKDLGDVRAPYEPLNENLYDDLEHVPAVPPSVPAGSSNYVGWPRVSDADRNDAGALAATRYVRSLQLSDDSAAAAGIPVRYFWQPTRFAQTGASAASDQPEAKAFDEAAKLLPPRVTDLTPVVNGRRERLFADDTNLDEAGAALIAEAMFSSLRPELQKLEHR